MIAFAVVVGAATFAAGILLALGLRLLPRIRLQLAGLALISVALPLVTVLASGWVMFHMHDDVKILAVASGAALSAIVAGLLLARWIVIPVDRLRSASERLASGDLASRAPEHGPAELAQLGASFNTMAGSLEELFDARRQLVAWASHDLRAPLTSMKAVVEALEDGLGTPAEYLPALNQQIGALSSIVDDLFELARIDAGSLTLRLEQADLRELIAGCLRGWEPEAQARQITLETRLDPDLAPVVVSPEKVERVLSNLLANALRHTPARGRVTVAAERRGENALVSVEDTGPGIAPGDAPRIFDRFWRADAARTGGSSGLGLAIAKGLVDAHGGAIWAEPAPAGGARIAFTLRTA